MKNGDFWENQHFPPILNCHSYSIYIYPVPFFSFEFDQLVLEVAMVRLSIVLNGLNTAKICCFQTMTNDISGKVESNSLIGNY